MHFREFRTIKGQGSNGVESAASPLKGEGKQSKKDGENSEENNEFVEEILLRKVNRR